MAETAFEGWAIVELMGHRQRGGYVKDVEMFGGKLLRIDIPVAEGVTVTEFYGVTAIYALRPCAEAIVRDHIKMSMDVRPVQPVEYRRREAKALARDGERYLFEPDGGEDTRG